MHSSKLTTLCKVDEKFQIKCGKREKIKQQVTASPETERSRNNIGFNYGSTQNQCQHQTMQGKRGKKKHLGGVAGGMNKFTKMSSSLIKSVDLKNEST